MGRRAVTKPRLQCARIVAVLMSTGKVGRTVLREILLSMLGLGAAAILAALAPLHPGDWYWSWVLWGGVILVIGSILGLVAPFVWKMWTTRPQATIPRPDEFIPLLDAATRAYEETRHDYIGGSVREQSHGDNEKILRWYCYALVGLTAEGRRRRMQLWGSRPPSRQRDPINIDNPTGDLYIENGTIVLRDRTNRSVIIGQDLVVASKGLPAAIANIRAIGEFT